MHNKRQSASNLLLRSRQLHSPGQSDAAVPYLFVRWKFLLYHECQSPFWPGRIQYASNNKLTIGCPYATGLAVKGKWLEDEVDEEEEEE